jgi:hypothetical protein
MKLSATTVTLYASGHELGKTQTRIDDKVAFYPCRQRGEGLVNAFPLTDFGLKPGFKLGNQIGHCRLGEGCGGPQL